MVASVASLVLCLLVGCHQIHEARARKLAASAMEFGEQGDYDRALEYSEIAIRLGAAEPKLHRMRGAIFLKQGRADLALAECDAGIALVKDWQRNSVANGDALSDTTDEAELHWARANALEKLKRPDEAREAFEMCLKLAPLFSGGHNNLAWLLATFPDESVRDAEAALEHAKRACKLTEWKQSGSLDTLAAAYAESGDFENAVRWQQEAITQSKNSEGSAHLEKYQSRLALYEAGQPFREELEMEPANGGLTKGATEPD